MGHLLAPGDPLKLLDELGVTVTLDRPTGELHARPRPVPVRARELLRANRDRIVAALADLLSCSGCGTTDADYLVPAHWDDTLAFCSRCCAKLDEYCVVSYAAHPNGDAEPGPIEQLLTDELGATVIIGPDGPPQAVRLGTEARERYRAGDKVKSKPLAHVWARCDKCGEAIMRPKGAGPKRCVITPGCQGRHIPVSAA